MNTISFTCVVPHKLAYQGLSEANTTWAWGSDETQAGSRVLIQHAHECVHACVCVSVFLKLRGSE